MDLRVEDRNRGSVFLFDVTFCAPVPRTLGNHPDAPVSRDALEAQAEIIRLNKARGRDNAAAKQNDSGVAREAMVELLVGPALRAAEERKRRRYADAVNRINPSNNQDAAAVVFVPLVFSSTGTYTPAVASTLRQLVDAVARERRNQAGSLWATPTKAHFMRTVIGTLSRQLQSTSAQFFGGARADH